MPMRLGELLARLKALGVTVEPGDGTSHYEVRRNGKRIYTIPSHNGLKGEVTDYYLASLAKILEKSFDELVGRARTTKPKLHGLNWSRTDGDGNDSNEVTVRWRDEADVKSQAWKWVFPCGDGPEAEALCTLLECETRPRTPDELRSLIAKTGRFRGPTTASPQPG